jgi:ribonuclease P protein component
VVVVRPGTAGSTRFGFITPKAVGPAIVRNRIRRRLRHLAAITVRAHPHGWDVVVRVVADCSRATTEELSGEWLRCLERAGLS